MTGARCFYYGGDPLNGCTNATGLLCSVSYSAPAYGTTPAALTRKSTQYDTYSRPVSTDTLIDGGTYTSQLAYDNQGRPKLAVYPQATSSAAALAVRTHCNLSGFADEIQNASTGYSYWKISARGADGQLTQATQGGVITVNQAYSGDGMARVSRINVTAGVSLVTPDADLGMLDQTISFDSVANLKARTLKSDYAARNGSELFSYDSLDRLIASTASTGNVTVLPDTGGYTYDAAGSLVNRAGISNTYNTNATADPLLNNNRLCGINAGTYNGAISYDLNGNLKQYTRPYSGVPGADGATIALCGYTAQCEEPQSRRVCDE